MTIGADNKIPFGLKNGILVQVSDVEPGLACGCVCPSCHRKLQANKGKIVSHYFSHDPSLDSGPCESARETSIHLMAKQILSEEGCATVPPQIITVRKRDADGYVHAEEGIAETESVKRFSNVELEKLLGEIRPDIVAYDMDGPLLIEVAVTNFTDSTKKARIRALGYRAIEIDLSNLSKTSSTVTRTELRDLVVENALRKKWLSNPKAVQIKKELNAVLDGKIRLINEEISARRKALESRKADCEKVSRRKANRVLEFAAPRTYDKRWFLCETCKSHFDLSSEDVPGDPNVISCPNCGHAVSVAPPPGAKC